MPNPRPADEKLLPLPFPMAGIDLTRSHSRQAPGTTPEAANVRVYAPLGDRARGGSRPGLERWIDAVVGGFTSDNVIQHLDVIVWTNNAALLAAAEHAAIVADPTKGIPDPSTNFELLGIPYPPIGDFDTDETPYTDDPWPPDTVPGPRARNPDRRIPPGGSGVPLRRGVPNAPESGGGLRPSKDRHYLSNFQEVIGDMTITARMPPAVGDGPPSVTQMPNGWDPTTVAGFLVDGGGLPSLGEANAACRTAVPTLLFDPYYTFYDE